jgi:hypothetical protein
MCNINIGTKTKEDAYLRVYNARLASLAEQPTEEYLMALRQQLYGFIGEVDAALHQLHTRQAEEEERREEEQDEHVDHHP